MATKKIVTTQEYIALVRIASEDGSEHWTAGSKIMLNDDQAAIHLRLRNVAAMENTAPPPLPEPTVVVHEAVI